VVSELDSQWQSTWKNLYNYTSLNVTWYSVLGNHDYHQSPDSQITYTKQSLDWRWKMEDHYFSKTFTDSQTGLSVKILFIDTIYLAPYAISQTPVTDPTTKYNAEIAWIQNELNSSTANWTIVVGHYPVYSIGDHGDTAELQSTLQLLLDYYQVDAYICGHDHTMQHITKGNVQHYVSGNGGKSGTLPKTTNATVQFAKISPGFMIHEVNVKNMTVKIYNASGAVIYSFTQVVNFKNITAGSSSPVIPDFNTVNGGKQALSVLVKAIIGIVISVVGLILLFLARQHHMRKRKIAQEGGSGPQTTISLGIYGKKKQSIH
jgi:tartrate-resistant acid phosphatase type 5